MWNRIEIITHITENNGASDKYFNFEYAKHNTAVVNKGIHEINKINNSFKKLIRSICLAKEIS